MPRKVAALNIGLLLMACAISIAGLVYGSTAVTLMGIATVVALCASFAVEAQIS